MDFATIDWLIIGLYGIVVVAIGLLYRGRAGKSLEEYFVSGRALPWWLAGTSMVATTFAADTPLAVTGLVIKNGLAGNWVWWSFAMGGMLTVFVFARYWRRAEVITDVELIALRYSGTPSKVLRVTRALYWALLINPIIVGWVCGGMLTVLEQAIFYRPPSENTELSFWRNPTTLAWLTLLAMFAFTALYSAVSGLWGVVVTDAIQFVFAMGGCIWLAVVAVNHFGGGDALTEQVTRNFGTDTNALSFWPDFSVSNPWMPLHIFCIILLVQWWATCYPGAEPGGGGYIVQRMSSCRTEKDSILAALWFQLAHYCLRPWPWIVIAFFALAMYPELRANYLADSRFDPGQGYAIAMRELCTPGLSGVIAVAFFSAFMSTISTQINWAASYVVRDVLQPRWGQKMSERELANFSRWISLLIVAESLGVAIWMKVSGVSIDEAWKLLMALGAGTGLFLMLRWFWWRVNAATEIAAMAWALFWYLATSTSLFQELLNLPDPLKSEEQIALVAGLTILCSFGVMLLTKPEPEEVLRGFYRRVRPFPWGWRRIAERELGTSPDRSLFVGIMGAMGGAGLVYCTLPLIGSLIFPALPVSQTFCLIGIAICGTVVFAATRRLVQPET